MKIVYKIKKYERTTRAIYHAINKVLEGCNKKKAPAKFCILFFFIYGKIKNLAILANR